MKYLDNASEFFCLKYFLFPYFDEVHQQKYRIRKNYLLINAFSFSYFIFSSVASFYFVSLSNDNFCSSLCSLISFFSFIFSYFSFFLSSFFSFILTFFAFYLFYSFAGFFFSFLSSFLRFLELQKFTSNQFHNEKSILSYPHLTCEMSFVSSRSFLFFPNTDSYQLQFCNFLKIP